MSGFSRRNLLRYSMFGAGIASVANLALPSVANAAPFCSGVATPIQPEGPFYPIHDQLDKDNDLVRVHSRSQQASGQLIYVLGHVLDSKCRPVEGALVEIWQACESGRYNHENDPNTAPLDPNFQYFGKVITDKRGQYIFRTIIPGEYPAGDGWIRPPHIHFRVAKRGYFELITQMYFAGNQLNSKDRILMSLPPSEQAAVVVEFAKSTTSEFEPNSGVGRFDITLRKA